MHKVVYPLITAIGFVAILLFAVATEGYSSGNYQLEQVAMLKAWCAYAGISGAGLCIFYILWQRPMGAKLAVIFVSALLGIAAFYLQQVELQVQQQVRVMPRGVALTQVSELVALGSQVGFVVRVFPGNQR